MTPSTECVRWSWEGGGVAWSVESSRRPSKEEWWVGWSGREYGINPEAVQAGANATAMSWFSDFTRAQARQVNDIVDYVYDRFILKVPLSTNSCVSKANALRQSGDCALLILPFTLAGQARQGLNSTSEGPFVIAVRILSLLSGPVPSLHCFVHSISVISRIVASALKVCGLRVLVFLFCLQVSSCVGH